jgi:hypothetical protein
MREGVVTVSQKSGFLCRHSFHDSEARADKVGASSKIGIFGDKTMSVGARKI